LPATKISGVEYDYKFVYRAQSVLSSVYWNFKHKTRRNVCKLQVALHLLFTAEHYGACRCNNKKLLINTVLTSLISNLVVSKVTWFYPLWLYLMGLCAECHLFACKYYTTWCWNCKAVYSDCTKHKTGPWIIAYEDLNKTRIILYHLSCYEKWFDWHLRTLLLSYTFPDAVHSDTLTVILNVPQMRINE